MHIDFGKWRGDEMTRCYSFRFTEAPKPLQHADCIETAVNPAHREGFDNVSFISKECYAPGVKARLCCAFEGKGCPEIILVEKPEICADGAVRYGACIEMVLYRNGVNIWRHFMDEDHVCSWHKRLGVMYPVTENERHELTLETKENYLTFSVDGQKTTLRVEDLFEKFYVGVTLCEGIARAYEMDIEP